MAEQRVVVIDCETTGLSPARGHRMVSFAAIALPRPGTGSPSGLHLVFNPERRCDPQAARVHGLSDDFLSHQPRFADHATAVRGFLAGALLVAHNATFDAGFLDHELAGAGLPPARFRYFCTMTEFRRRHPGHRATLDDAARLYGLDVTARQRHHGAFVDAWIAGQLYCRLAWGVDPHPAPMVWPDFDNLRMVESS